MAVGFGCRSTKSKYCYGKEVIDHSSCYASETTTRILSMLVGHVLSWWPKDARECSEVKDTVYSRNDWNFLQRAFVSAWLLLSTTTPDSCGHNKVVDLSIWVFYFSWGSVPFNITYTQPHHFKIAHQCSSMEFNGLDFLIPMCSIIESFVWSFCRSGFITCFQNRPSQSSR